jgi:uncharacterized RDD family membrane protein YckC
MYCRVCGTQRPESGASFCPSCGTAYDEGVAGVASADYASWWSRVGASLLDGLVMAVILIPVLVWLIHVALDGGVHLQQSGAARDNLVIHRKMYEALAVSAVYWVTALVLYTGLTMRRPGSRNGQTLGKQALNIRVARDSGDAVSFRFAAAREVAVKTILLGAIGRIPIAGGIAEIVWYLWPLWDKTNRAPHDMIVKSHVVRANRPSDAWGQ